MESDPTLTGLRLPIPWDHFDLESPWTAGATTLVDGETAWNWSTTAPDFPIPSFEPPGGNEVADWSLDHVVLLVASVENAIEAMAAVGASPRLRMEVRGRPTAFFRVGPVLEVIESPVRVAGLYGVALVTQEPLEVVALRWRSAGIDVTDPKPAIQPGRRIMTVRNVDAGLAIMSPERAIA